MKSFERIVGTTIYGYHEYNRYHTPEGETPYGSIYSLKYIDTNNEPARYSIFTEADNRYVSKKKRIGHNDYLHFPMLMALGLLKLPKDI